MGEPRNRAGLRNRVDQKFCCGAPEKGTRMVPGNWAPVPEAPSRASSGLEGRSSRVEENCSGQDKNVVFCFGTC